MLAVDFTRDQAGETELELISPLSQDNTVARFLERRGPGLHHICFEVDDVAAEMGEIAARGAEFVESEPHPGAVGLVSFIQPASAGGVLVEINQPLVPTAPELAEPAAPLKPRAPRRRKPAPPPSEDGLIATAPEPTVSPTAEQDVSEPLPTGE